MCQDEDENKDKNQSFGWFWNLYMTYKLILQCIIVLRTWFVRHMLYPERKKTFVFGFVFVLSWHMLWPIKVSNCLMVRNTKNHKLLQKITMSEMEVIDCKNGNFYLSPKKMFDVTKRAVDKVLSPAHQMVRHQGQWFRITAHEFAPVTLRIENVKNKSHSFEVDLVPTIQLPSSMLNSAFGAELWYRIERMIRKVGITNGKQVSRLQLSNMMI